MGSFKAVGLEKSYGIHTLFSHVNLEIMRGNKIGLVGANGSGKTTLMRVLLGREEADDGTVSVDPTDTIGYVEQQAVFSSETLYDELYSAFSDIILLREEKERMERRISAGQSSEEDLKAYGNLVNRFESMNGYDFERHIRRVAFGLGFSEPDLTKDVHHFSGGQTTRICLAKALLREPDFLFLDEPTNHLDIGMIEWLEEFIRSYRGGVLLISHDRYFLDRVASHILELEHQTITSYTGNYTHYIRIKNERRAALQHAYEKQQDHIRKTEEFIRKYKAGIKAKQARGRQSQLNRLERIILPPEAAQFQFFSFAPPEECAQRVAELEDVSFSYQDGLRILDHISLLIRKGDGVALIGENGAGKTTTFYMTVGLVVPNEGHIYLDDQDITKYPVYRRAQAGIGYLAQEASIYRKLSVEDNILSVLELTNRTKQEQQARLEELIAEFRLEKVRTNAGNRLSGGERRRAEIARCLAIDPKFIMLDEPFAGVDPIAVQDIQSIVAQLRHKNIGILITDHNVYETLSITDRAYLLFEGKVLFEGTAEELAENEIVREKYLGKDFQLRRRTFDIDTTKE